MTHLCFCSYRSVNNTGETQTNPGTSCAQENLTVTENLMSLNPLFSSIEGNPLPEPEE